MGILVPLLLRSVTQMMDYIYIYWSYRAALELGSVFVFGMAEHSRRIKYDKTGESEFFWIFNFPITAPHDLTYANAMKNAELGNEKLQSFCQFHTYLRSSGFVKMFSLGYRQCLLNKFWYIWFIPTVKRPN